MKIGNKDFIYGGKNLFINKLLLFNVYIFPFFVVVTAALIVIESATYPGFVSNYLFLDANSIFILLIASGILASGTMRAVRINKSWLNYYTLLGQLNKLLLPAIIVVGYIFISLESRNYRGFVYTRGFHFDPLYFFHLFAISGFLIFLDLTNKFQNLPNLPTVNNLTDFIAGTNKQLPNLASYSRRYFIAITTIVVLGWLTYGNIIEVVKDVFPRIGAIASNPFRDKDEKLRYQHEDFYDFMEFVKLYTPQDAVIMRMPQQGKWPSLSNDGYVRHFIYPRYTKAGDENTLNDPSISYVFIHRAYSPPRVDKYIEKWPTFKVPAKRVLYLDDNNYNKPPIIIEGDYDPSDTHYDEYWGLIELKRES